jgi:hypothetical protein
MTSPSPSGPIRSHPDPSPLEPSSGTSLCLEFASGALRAEPTLLRRAADWLEANPEAELLSIEVLPSWLIGHQTFLRLIVLPEGSEPHISPEED